MADEDDNEVPRIPIDPPASPLPSLDDLSSLPSLGDLKMPSMDFTSTPMSPPAPPGSMPPSALHASFGEPTQPVAAPAPEKSAPPPAPAVPKDAVRDIVETVVFVIVLVLLLKTFIAEAFVIPTGSMATTLWGYQKVVTCPQCGHVFPVNASSEVDPQQGAPRMTVTSCTCPNCRFPIHSGLPAPNSGDRVLVSKFAYDCLPLSKPELWDVVVFKFPKEPQKNHVALNYIKRLVGLPSQTIGIYYGDLYVAEGLAYADEPLPANDHERWKIEYAYINKWSNELKKDAVSADQARKFRILRKSPEQILAMSRLVYDNDHQAKDLAAANFPPRWAPEEDDPGGWQTNPAQPTAFKHASKAALSWLRYRHILRPRDDKAQPKKELITDFMGYNTNNDANPAANWVGDLILECEVLISSITQGDEMRLELSKGADRFEARFDLNSGECTLWREGPIMRKKPDGTEEQVKQKTSMNKPGRYLLRFANVDRRLTLWVNKELPFGDGDNGGVVYDPPKNLGPTENDLEPASIGVKGAEVTVSKLKLYRDTYYIARANEPHIGRSADKEIPSSAWADPGQWEELRDLPAVTMYVQPGHYLCLGDNSSQSSDGREWGTVPDRLLLGRALVVYYPFKFPFWPLANPVNRTGFIE